MCATNSRRVTITATITTDGTVTPPIRGIPLNGNQGNSTTDHNGHTTYARAMGVPHEIRWSAGGSTRSTS
ncbi:hypothetical protein AB0J47_05955 [Nocardia sp. NPDC049737]|uniref:hypothetical protein n=1 Tax=Nocardia sp. NPDC049737 TaxID=3154358 RepID=UPI0034475F9D